MIVNFVNIKKPFDNKIDINIIVQYFGENIPKYITLDSEDKSGTYYVCCMCPEVDVKEICHYMGYVCYNIHEANVDSKMFNSLSKIKIMKDNNNHEYYDL